MPAPALGPLWTFLGTLAALGTLPGTLELLLVSLGGLLPSRKRPAAAPSTFKLAALVPVAGDAAAVAKTAASLVACGQGDWRFSVLVVADAGTEASATSAEEAGARLLVRKEPEKPGRPFLLDFAFRTLLVEGFDGFIVVEPGSEVESPLAAEVRAAFAAGADAAQLRYAVPAAGDSAGARLRRAAFAAENVVRPRGRDRLGLSCGILGNGLALRRETLLSVPYGPGASQSDWEYHHRLVRARMRVAFLDKTRLSAAASGTVEPFPWLKWEPGHLRLLGARVPALLLDVVLGRLRLLEPLFTLLLLPPAFHLGLLLLAIAVPFGPGRVYALFGLAAALLYGLQAILAAPRGTKTQ